MSLSSVIVALLVGIGISEFCDVSPSVARKIVRWSARRKYTEPERAEIRSEELAALIDERPGNLLKLCTAFGYAGTAIAEVALRCAGVLASKAFAIPHMVLRVRQGDQMLLTPEDVRNKQFSTTRLRPGYDEEEVDAFLDEVEAELDRLIRENRELRVKLALHRRGCP
jgi:DivIVA domain-containing protein